MRKRVFVFTAAVSWAALTALSGASAATVRGPNDGHWQAQSWADAVARLPCAAFEQRTRGRWIMRGTVDLPGPSVVSNMTFGPDAQSHVLDVRCNPRDPQAAIAPPR